MESAQAKNQALRDAGAVVPTSYESFEGTIKEAFKNLSLCRGCLRIDFSDRFLKIEVTREDAQAYYYFAKSVM
ncbi:hypothetical protein CQW23_16748 [Capsicum baccatum]|uniref:Uncharacterized protein n=1 Tax=Capsicum baccatum TaxID=33114 RepID=A0A2G2WBU9_CAPBA|nr:hypothetical protein CQW23_16748 [Capsicum baccatum]